jgi:hypothetical protein
MGTVLSSRSFKFLFAPGEAPDIRAEVTEIFSRIANPMTTTARTRKGNMPASKASASANALLSNLDF